MGLQKNRSSLDVWLDRGESSEKFWKLVFYFFSRFILVFCVLHYFGVAYPQMGWVFPGPASVVFWGFCVLFAAIFAAVFYVVRGKRRASRDDSASGDGLKKDKVRSSPAIRSSPAMGVQQKREGRRGGVVRATLASEAEEKNEGRRGGVARATFVSEPETAGPETSGPELEEERSEHKRDRRE